MGSGIASLCQKVACERDVGSRSVSNCKPSIFIFFLEKLGSSPQYTLAQGRKGAHFTPSCDCITGQA